MNKVVALDIGATNMRFAVVDESLKIIHVERIKTVNESSKAFIETIVEHIDELLTKEQDIKAIVVGVPGYVNTCDIIEELPNLHLENIDLKKHLIKRFKLPVHILNDAVAAGYAEAFNGAGKEYNRVYYMTISSGVGGAFFVNGKEELPFKENGHMLLKYMDKYYDAERLLSGYGLVFLAKLNHIEISTSSEFFAKYKHDPKLNKVYCDWLKLFGDFFKILEGIYQPDVFILGGGVMLSSSHFFDDFCGLIKTKMLIAKFDQDVGIIGSATYGFLRK